MDMLWSGEGRGKCQERHRECVWWYGAVMRGQGKCEGRLEERVYGHVVDRAGQGRGKCQGRLGEHVYGHVVVRAGGSARGDWGSMCMDMVWSGQGRGECQGRHRGSVCADVGWS